MQFRTLTDNELLLLVDNLPGADELLRELAQRLVDKGYMQAAVDALDNVGIDYTRTADLEQLETAIAFDRQHGCAVAEKLIDACAKEDVYDAGDFERLAETAKRVSLLEEQVDDLNAEIATLKAAIDSLT